MTARTSDRVSSIAARYNTLTPARLLAMTAKDSSLHIAVDEIQAMAASLMRQDEQKGLRKYLKWPFPRSFMSSEDRP
jgi:hypothetical protein